MIVDPIVDLESDSYRNGCPILLESEFELSTIRFGTPNGLSLVPKVATDPWSGNTALDV